MRVLLWFYDPGQSILGLSLGCVSSYSCPGPFSYVNVLLCDTDTIVTAFIYKLRHTPRVCPMLRSLNMALCSQPKRDANFFFPPPPKPEAVCVLNSCSFFVFSVGALSQFSALYMFLKCTDVPQGRSVTKPCMQKRNC